MTKAQKFTYFTASLTGKAAAKLQGLQFSTEKLYDQGLQLLKDTLGRHERSVDLCMSELLRLPKVKSAKDIEQLRTLLQGVQVNMLALYSVNVKRKLYSPMLIPVLKRVISLFSVEF